MNLPERFLEKVCFEALTGCWLWTASKTRNNERGYGQFWDIENKRLVLAHRFAYEAIKGPIPQGLDLDHLCRNRACCNPDHLEPVCRGENMARAPYWKSKEVCVNGHSLTPDNRIERKNNAYKAGYACRKCKNAYDLRYNREKRVRRKTA